MNWNVHVESDRFIGKLETLLGHFNFLHALTNYKIPKNHKTALLVMSK